MTRLASDAKALKRAKGAKRQDISGRRFQLLELAVQVFAAFHDPCVRQLDRVGLAGGGRLCGDLINEIAGRFERGSLGLPLAAQELGGGFGVVLHTVANEFRVRQVFDVADQGFDLGDFGFFLTCLLKAAEQN